MELVARHGTEVVICIRNASGVLSEVARILADRGLELMAVNASAEGDYATIRLVTDDNLRASDILRAHGYEPMEAPVVMIHLPHKPGLLHRMTERLAEEMINMDHFYLSALPKQTECLVVLHTEHDDRALWALNETFSYAVS